MSDVRDFDAFWAEKEDAEGTPATITVKFEGCDYEVPASPSAPVLLRVARLNRDGTDTVGLEDLLGLAEGVLGKDVISAISAASPNVNPEKLMSFLQWVGEKQMGTDSPNRETRRANQRGRSTSSRRGASSKPTSSASTGSISASV